MLYEEFCMGIGEEVSLKDYETIESVYRDFHRFYNKNNLYSFYKKHGMDGILALHVECVRLNQLLAQRAAIQAEITKMQILYGMDAG